MKTTITRAEYLQLLGLDTMCRQHVQKIDEIRESIFQLLNTSDEEDKAGDISDLVWAGNGISVNEALRRMGIAILENEHAQSRRR